MVRLLPAERRVVVALVAGVLEGARAELRMVEHLDARARHADVVQATGRGIPREHVEPSPGDVRRLAITRAVAGGTCSAVNGGGRSTRVSARRWAISVAVSSGSRSCPAAARSAGCARSGRMRRRSGSATG